MAEIAKTPKQFRKPKPAKKKRKNDPDFSKLLKNASKEKKEEIKDIDNVNIPSHVKFMSSGTVTISNSKTETVNHPAHYGGEHNPYEAIKVIEAWGANFNLGNALKYISRAGKKGLSLEDLKKAAWYLNREIQNIEKL